MIKQIKTEDQPNIEKNSQEIHFLSDSKPHWGEKLTRNLAVAGMLVLTISAIRNEQLPSGQTVLTAVQEMIDANWDENLGKISFVSNMLPETVAVFFETPAQADLVAPCFGEIRHPWTDNEPYLGFASTTNDVFAVADGQVMSISHGLDEERIVRVRQNDGLETMYYNLAQTFVSEGDQVSAASRIGEALPNQEVVIEVRRAGRAIDPTSLLSPREMEKP